MYNVYWGSTVNSMNPKQTYLNLQNPTTGKYSDISDSEVDTIVKTIQQHHPGVGLRLLKGYLQSRGITLQRERIRQSLLRTDPTGVLQVEGVCSPKNL